MEISRPRLLLALALMLTLATALATDATADVRQRVTAKPRVSIAVSGAGYSRTVTVTVVKGRAATPVRRGVVLAGAEMNAPGHHMRVAPRRLREVSPGVYRGRLTFVMLGRWVVRASVDAGAAGEASAQIVIRLS